MSKDEGNVIILLKSTSLNFYLDIGHSLLIIGHSYFMNTSSHSPSGPRPLETLLAAAERALLAWDDGAHLDDLLPATAGQATLRHGLFALFRRRAEVDWLIARFAARPPRPRLLRILRWTFVQILFQDGVRPEAAANAAVAYVRRRYGQAEAGFLNAVLRAAVAAGREPLLATLADAAPAAVRRNLGPELEAAWRAGRSEAQLDALAALLQAEAPLTFRLRPGAPPPDPAWEAERLEFGRQKIEDSRQKIEDGMGRQSDTTADGGLLNSTVFWRCGCPERLLASAAFARGDVYVQDPSTSLAPGLVAARPGERIADLCAAPGGKALLLAEAMAGENNGTDGTNGKDGINGKNGRDETGGGAGPGLLLCADRSAARLQRLRENLARCEVRVPVQVLAADAARPPLAAGQWDAVLLDVPCSNSGVIRRRPDARWRFTRAKVAELAVLQARLLDGAAPLLRPGGRLVYSTCSLEPAENHNQVRAFLKRHPEFALETEQQLLPAADHDGGYAAHLRATATAG
jgi:16S rRNA (cytosine967-C5)-methyltransferase